MAWDRRGLLLRIIWVTLLMMKRKHFAMFLLLLFLLPIHLRLLLQFLCPAAANRLRRGLACRIRCRRTVRLWRYLPPSSPFNRMKIAPCFNSISDSFNITSSNININNNSSSSSSSASDQGCRLHSV